MSIARSRQRAALALLLNAFVWGCSWYPFRHLEEQGLHPLWATCLIYVLCLGLLLTWRPGAWRPLLSSPWLWLLMAASGLTSVSFNWAVTIGDVVRVVLLFYLMPAWSVLLAWLLLRERPTQAALLRLGLALAGVVIVLKSPQSDWPLPVGLPDWLALAGGFSFALTNVLLRRLRALPETSRMTAIFGGGASLAAVVALLGQSHGLAAPPCAPALGWLVVALLTGLAFLAASAGLQYGAAHLPAAAASLILLTEVMFASVSSVLLGAAELQERTLVGGGLILLAAAWAAWPERGTGTRDSGTGH
ncbi:DMT family transporter [Hylemonella sp. W303a]|uniref:DMT family transporter n=1 Tax=Hylemonella sp. W303a TaxID=3389873 RepID=UPI00396B167C